MIDINQFSLIYVELVGLEVPIIELKVLLDTIFKSSFILIIIDPNTNINLGYRILVSHSYENSFPKSHFEELLKVTIPQFKSLSVKKVFSLNKVLIYIIETLSLNEGIQLVNGTLRGALSYNIRYFLPLSCGDNVLKTSFLINRINKSSFFLDSWIKSNPKIAADRSEVLIHLWSISRVWYTAFGVLESFKLNGYTTEEIIINYDIIISENNKSLSSSTEVLKDILFCLLIREGGYIFEKDNGIQDVFRGNSGKIRLIIKLGDLFIHHYEK